MENITLTGEDLDLAFETYISICREDAKIIQSSSEYFLVIISVILIQYNYKHFFHVYPEFDEQEKWRML